MPKEIKIRLPDKFFDRREYFRSGKTDPTQIIFQALEQNPELIEETRKILREKGNENTETIKINPRKMERACHNPHNGVFDEFGRVQWMMEIAEEKNEESEEIKDAGTK